MTASSTMDYVANSVELIGIEVTAGGARMLAGVKLGLLKAGDPRESIVWKDPETIGSRWGYKMDGTLPPGKYEVWAKVITTDEQVWLDAGVITLY